MSSSKAVLPYSMKDVDYDNAKFRYRSPFKVMTQAWYTSSLKLDCRRCTVGKFLILLLIGGLAYLLVMDKGSSLASNGVSKHVTKAEAKFGRFWRKPPRLPPQLSPDEVHNASFSLDRDKISLRSEWISRQAKVKEAFIHAWSGYSKYAMGYDELMPLSQRGVDGLGGLGATVVDALDTAMIMGIDKVASEAGTWVEKHLMERINSKGRVNLFETTIRVLGGLLSAYHLSGGEQSNVAVSGISKRVKGVKAEVLLNIAKNLADRLLSAFTSSPTPIPFSDVVLHDRSAHPAPGGLSSTSEVSTLQLEFNYLSKISGDPKYCLEAMKTLEHFRTLPKVEGLVPIYISPHTGQFSGENIRLGSRGDSYYEYLIKVWIQQKNSNKSQVKYLYEMYEEAMKGVHQLLVQKSIPKGLVFVGELPYGSKGDFSPKMDHLGCLVDEWKSALSEKG